MYSLFFFVYLYFQSENIAVTCPKRTWEFRKKRLLYYLLLYPRKRCFSSFLTKKTRNFSGALPWTHWGAHSTPPPDPQLMFYMPLAHSFFALQKTNVPIFFLYYTVICLIEISIFVSIYVTINCAINANINCACYNKLWHSWRICSETPSTFIIYKQP